MPILKMNTNIGDLPDALLVEILSRLPCYKYISRCKCVSKLWCTVMSDPSFIRRFLCILSDSKQTFMTRTLINCKGEEFLARMSSSFKALTPLFKRLMNLHHLKEEPVVVGSYNDLVLCCASKYYQRDYYICNPYKLECVHLPPPPQVTELTAVGIFCDLPYYTCKKNDLGGRDIQINAEYRCRVVRIILHRSSEMPPEMPPFKVKVQIFSSETGEWRETIVSTPSGFDPLDVNFKISFAHNGMLYWLSTSGDFLIGLDPFMDNRTSASISSISSRTVDGDNMDHYELLYTAIDGCDSLVPGFLGVYNGCLQIGAHKQGTYDVHAWELHKELHGGSGKLCLEQRKRVYSLPLQVGRGGEYFVDLVGFDPNNDGTEDEGKFTQIFENHPLVDGHFTVAMPWWPTPVPRLPENHPLILARLD